MASLFPTYRVSVFQRSQRDLHAGERAGFVGWPAARSSPALSRVPGGHPLPHFDIQVAVVAAREPVLFRVSPALGELDLSLRAMRGGAEAVGLLRVAVSWVGRRCARALLIPLRLRSHSPTHQRLKFLARRQSSRRLMSRKIRRMAEGGGGDGLSTISGMKFGLSDTESTLLIISLVPNI